MAKKVLLIAGHGAGDPGAVANGAQEHEEMQKVVSQVQKILNGTDISLEIITGGYNLSGKIAYANKTQHDLVMEVHMDSASAGAQGATMLYYGGSNWSKDQAQIMVNEYCKGAKVKNRGVKADTTTRFKRLGIIRDVRDFSLLLETGFISNKEDLALVRANAANAIAYMLLSYYNIPVANPVFKDVPDNHPYAKFAKWAKDNGIMTGYEDGTLGIDEKLTVGRLLAILYKFYNFIKK